MGVSFQHPDWREQFCDEVRRLIPLVRELFGLEPRPWQIRAWQQLFKGSDILVRAGTGSGKSLVFQAMVRSRDKAIVLVIGPLISLMEDQVDEWRKISDRQTDESKKISAIALTAENLHADPTLWDKVKNGEFQIVYASPEVLLEPGGRFQTDIFRTKNEFMQNLVLTAVDECHCIYSWEDFRPFYGHVGKLRLILSNVPWALFSATLMPHVAAYVASVCNLLEPPILFSLSIKRDNIKLAVIPIDDINDINDTKILFRLLNRNAKNIQKTIIFTDSIDRASQLTLQMKARLEMGRGPPEDLMKRVFRNRTIGAYWSTIDDRRKKKVMKNFKEGLTKILIGTDACSLGVNVDDVDLTIQWGVTEKLTLDILWQRMGRGGRGEGRTSYGLVFAERKLLKAAQGAWEAALKPKDPQLPPTWEDLDQLPLKPLPVCKGRDLDRFTLPVAPDTMDLVYTHVSGLYREVAEIKETFQKAKEERQGTHKQPVSAAQKTDPFGCWFLNSDGCLHQIIKVAFRQPGNIFAHRCHCDDGWDCDRCARRKGLDPQTPLPCGLTLGDTMAYVLKDPVPRPPSELSKVVQEEPIRPDKMNASRNKKLAEFLMKWRKDKCSQCHFPSMIRPCMTLPDFAVSHIVKNITRIVTPKQLRRSLKAAKFDLTSSLLSATDLAELLHEIEMHLHSTDKPNIQTVSLSATGQKRSTDESTSSSQGPNKTRKLNTKVLASAPTPTLVPDAPAHPVLPHTPSLSFPATVSSRKHSEIEDASLPEPLHKKRAPPKQKLLNLAKVPMLSSLDVPSIVASPVSQNPGGISSIPCPSPPTASQVNATPPLQKGRPKRQRSRQPLQIIDNLHNSRKGMKDKRPLTKPARLEE